MNHRSNPLHRLVARRGRLRTEVALLCTLLGCEGGETGAREIESSQQPLVAARHKEATQAGAFGWVEPSTARELVKVSTIGDSDPEYKTLSATHFDNCYWNEGRDWVIRNRNAAVDFAVQYQATGRKSLLHSFYEALGFVMHATQDFYAHSNWVETHEPGVLAPFNEPNAPMPEGWYSGTFNNPGDTGPDAGAAHCPPGTPSHAQLNKDRADTAGGDEAIFDATLATSDQLRRVIAGIRAAVPADADRVLAAVGFLSPSPSSTGTRADYTRSVEVSGGPLGLTTPPLFCKPGSYVASFSQLVESRGADATGLNTVLFSCRDGADGSEEPLIAWAGSSGTWSMPRACASGFIDSGELKVQPLASSGDNTSANAARFWCNDDSALLADNDGPLGAWSGAASCGAGEAMCGVQIKYQPGQGAYQPGQGEADDTAMNGLTLLCCALAQ